MANTSNSFSVRTAGIGIVMVDDAFHYNGCLLLSSFLLDRYFHGRIDGETGADRAISPRQRR